MSFIRAVVHWAASVFGFGARLAGDVGRAVTAIWHYVTSVHNVLSWLFKNPVLTLAVSILRHFTLIGVLISWLTDALHRIARWIWATYVQPLRALVILLYYRAVGYTNLLVSVLRRLVILLYYRAVGYTNLLVSTERRQRIRADQAEHAAMLKTVAALHQAIENEAARGYDSQLHGRLGVISTLLDDLAVRNPAVRDLVSRIVAMVIDLEAIDNPLFRFAAGKLLTEVIDKAGVDKVTGDLAARLLDILTAGGRPRNLGGVDRDLAARVNALEQQWADFMTSGGPEILQAGKEWKDLTSVLTDAALAGFLGLAFTDPQAWATGMADTVGVAGKAVFIAFTDLIRRL